MLASVGILEATVRHCTKSDPSPTCTKGAGFYNKHYNDTYEIT
jgi:hypothetical protein